MTNKTVPTSLAVEDYIASIDKAERRADCEWLLSRLTELTGETPKLWGGTLKSAIFGFGEYHYRYDSGREGDFMRIGFANRAQSISIYLMPGYENLTDELSRLGTHKVGKSCLYLKRLSDVDTDILTEMMKKSLTIMADRYPE